MKQQFSNNACRAFPLFFFSACLLLALLLSLHGVEAYENYTVGDSLGWYDKLEKPNVNYQKWAAAKNFSLGDFLIFKTDKNHTVVQTYNATTYKKCDYNDAEEDDTSEWSAGAPAFDTKVVSIAVPLVKEGANYFFSGLYDGEQCRHGQRFKINVTHGQGLPESLRNPTTSDSPAPVSPNDAGTVPDTVVPANFDNPKDTGVIKPSSGAGGITLREGSRYYLGFVVLGLVIALN